MDRFVHISTPVCGCNALYCTQRVKQIVSSTPGHSTAR